MKNNFFCLFVGLTTCVYDASLSYHVNSSCTQSHSMRITVSAGCLAKKLITGSKCLPLNSRTTVLQKYFINDMAIIKAWNIRGD